MRKTVGPVRGESCSATRSTYISPPRASERRVIVGRSRVDFTKLNKRPALSTEAGFVPTGTEANVFIDRGLASARSPVGRLAQIGRSGNYPRFRGPSRPRSWTVLTWEVLLPHAGESLTREHWQRKSNEYMECFVRVLEPPAMGSTMPRVTSTIRKAALRSHAWISCPRREPFFSRSS